MGEGLKISKNFEIKKRIKTLDELYRVLNEEKSLYVCNWKRISPTAFLLSWQFKLITKWLYSGQFYTIKKIKK